MSKIFLHLQKVHDLVHDLEHYSPINHFNLLKQKDFTAPKIFTGGVNILLWNQLSESEKVKALSKSWYIYYSFRDAKTGKLKRMPNIKGNTNKLKTKKERVEYLNAMSESEKKIQRLSKINPSIISLIETFDLIDEKGNGIRTF